MSTVTCTYTCGVNSVGEALPGADSRVPLSLQVRDLYDDPRLMPMLRKLVKTTCGLTDAVGGSISLVDSDAGKYTKIAEIGTSCRLGQSFSLDEGVTGQVLSRRGPVVLDTYREIGRGHLTAGHPAWDGAVVAIPLWWRGDIVAVNVIFAGVARRFGMDEVDRLELITQVMAPGVVTAMDRERPTSAGLRRSQGGLAIGHGARDGVADRVFSVDEVMRGLLSLAQRVAVHQSDPVPYLHVSVCSGGGPPRMLVRQAADLPGVDETVPASPVWYELVDDGAAGVALQQITRAATALAEHGPLVELPAISRQAMPSPFTEREHDVVKLLARGLSDRTIARELCLSPKTVEKHVGAVLRKTETSSRTAAVVHCIQQGWLADRHLG